MVIGHSRLTDFIEEENEKNLHILTHPGWWQTKVMQPRDRIIRAIEGRKQKNIKLYDQELKNLEGRIFPLKFSQCKKLRYYYLEILVGIPLLIKHIPRNNISGIIAASIRPQYHKELKKIAKSFKSSFHNSAKIFFFRLH